MYKLSVTTIEKYRRYMVGASSYDTEAALLESIQGIFTGNDKTKIGSAYHKVIEGESLIVENGAHVAEGVYFTQEQAQPALDFRKAHPLMIHEISVWKIYDTKIGPVLISGRVDGQEGKETEDKKCKFGTPAWQEYINSYQWRYYLDILATDIFWYDLFEVRGFEELRGFSPYPLPGVTFHAHERLQCVRYREMPRDCISMLNDFIDYLELRQLWRFVKTAPDLQTIA